MSVYVYDPTVSDSLSKVRGIGRYLQVLKENLPSDTVFTSRLDEVPYNSTLINPFINLIQPPIVTRRIAKRQIGMIHDAIPLEFPEHFPIGLRGKLSLWQNKRAFQYYDTFITNSNSSRKNIISKLGISNEKIQVIYPSLPKAFMQITPRSNSKFKFPYVIYVGDVTWNKNLVNLAKAIKLANVSCVLVGNSFKKLQDENLNIKNKWLEEAQEFMKLAKNDKRFIFPGFVSDTELVSLYKNAIANILVSREEGLGFSYFEAGTQKVPSILSNIEIFHETSHDSALFVDPDSPEELAQAIKIMMVDKKLRQNLGQKAFERSALLLDSTVQWKALLA